MSVDQTEKAWTLENGVLLSRALAARGLRPNEFAGFARLHRNVVHNMIHARVQPDATTLRKVMTALQQMPPMPASRELGLIGPESVARKKKAATADGEKG